MEHRWGRRMVVDIPIQLTAVDPSGNQRARLANLSVSGGLIRADYKPRLLSRVQIGFDSLLRSGIRELRIAAYVARLYPHGFAVEWCELDSRTVTDILRAASTQLHQPAEPAAVSGSARATL